MSFVRVVETQNAIAMSVQRREREGRVKYRKRCRENIPDAEEVCRRICFNDRLIGTIFSNDN
jgi:hypothetical protein